MFFLTVIIFNLFIYFLLKKYSLLSSYTGEKHQIFVGKKSIPLSLGVTLFYIFFIFFLTQNNQIILFFLTILFLLGLGSDLKKIKSPTIRFFFQSIIIFGFIYITDLKIYSIRIESIDYLLTNNLINFFFISFCILVLINGTNFIDGLNGLVISFYLTFIIILNSLGLLNFIEGNNLNFLLISLFFLLILNLLDKGYLGDNGVYLSAFIFGYFAIKSFNYNNEVSPYFYVLILYYPAFENLFSIIRKYKFNKSPIRPDSNHMHHLIFYFIKKKLKFNNLILNNFSSFVIFSFNLFFILLGKEDIYNTKFQVFLIILYSIIYMFAYSVLYKFKLSFQLRSLRKH